LGGQAQSSQHLTTHSSRLAMSDAYGNPFDHFLRFEERVRAVTTQNIRSVFEELLRSNPPQIGLVGPENTWRTPSQLAWGKGLS
jgi:predicted Zn-dependent peptidase